MRDFIFKGIYNGKPFTAEPGSVWPSGAPDPVPGLGVVFELEGVRRVGEIDSITVDTTKEGQPTEITVKNVH